MADVDDPYDPGNAEEWIDLAHKHGNMIALRVRGNSMNRIAVENSVIIVDLEDRHPIDGKHYVFRHKGQATFKTYRRGPPQRMEPQSDDPEYQTLYPTEGIEVVGRVIRKTEEL